MKYSLIDKIWSALKVCGFCGNRASGDGPYCIDCLKHLSKCSQEKIKVLGYPWPLYSMYCWGQHTERVHHLIYQLKGGGYNSFVNSQCEEFLYRYSKSNPLGKKICFIPAPPKNRGDQDHAFVLAKNFAELTGGRVFDGLARESEEGAQKQKHKDERQKRRTKLIRNFFWTEVTVIVDDLVTTGSTVNSIIETLKPKGPVMVWSLSYRPWVFEKSTAV